MWSGRTPADQRAFPSRDRREVQLDRALRGDLVARTSASRTTGSHEWNSGRSPSEGASCRRREAVGTRPGSASSGRRGEAPLAAAPERGDGEASSRSPENALLFPRIEAPAVESKSSRPARSPRSLIHRRARPTLEKRAVWRRASCRACWTAPVGTRPRRARRGRRHVVATKESGAKAAPSRRRRRTERPHARGAEAQRAPPPAQRGERAGRDGRLSPTHATFHVRRTLGDDAGTLAPNAASGSTHDRADLGRASTNGSARGRGARPRRVPRGRRELPRARGARHAPRRARALARRTRSTADAPPRLQEDGGGAGGREGTWDETPSSAGHFTAPKRAGPTARSADYLPPAGGVPGRAKTLEPRDNAWRPPSTRAGSRAGRRSDEGLDEGSLSGCGSAGHLSLRDELQVPAARSRGTHIAGGATELAIELEVLLVPETSRSSRTTDVSTRRLRRSRRCCSATRGGAAWTAPSALIVLNPFCGGSAARRASHTWDSRARGSRRLVLFAREADAPRGRTRTRRARRCVRSRRGGRQVPPAVGAAHLSEKSRGRADALASAGAWVGARPVRDRRGGDGAAEAILCSGEKCWPRARRTRGRSRVAARCRPRACQRESAARVGVASSAEWRGHLACSSAALAPGAPTSQVSLVLGRFQLEADTAGSDVEPRSCAGRCSRYSCRLAPRAPSRKCSGPRRCADDETSCAAWGPRRPARERGRLDESAARPPLAAASTGTFATRRRLGHLHTGA